jgi:hypothetical protein
MYAGHVNPESRSPTDHPSLVADLDTGLKLVEFLGGSIAETTFFLHRDIEFQQADGQRRTANLKELRRGAESVAAGVRAQDRLVFIVSNHFDVDKEALLVDGPADEFDEGSPDERDAIPIATFAELLDSIRCEQVIIASTCKAERFVEVMAAERRLVFAAGDAVHDLHPTVDPPRIIQHDAFVDALVSGASVAEAYDHSLKVAQRCDPPMTPLCGGAVSFLRA